MLPCTSLLIANNDSAALRQPKQKSAVNKIPVRSARLVILIDTQNNTKRIAKSKYITQ